MGALRIAMDYRPALLGRSGIPRAVRELARALAARGGLDLRLFAHSLSAARVAVETPAGARLCRWPIPGRALPALRRWGLDGGRLAGGVDVFHWTDYVHPPVLPRTAIVLTLHDCAFAVDPTFHGHDSTTLMDRTRAASKRADAVVCPTRASATDAAELLAVPDERLHVVPFGVDHVRPGVATELDRTSGPIVMLGTIEPRKNHVRAIAAWRALGDGRPELVVVGAPGWCHEDAVRVLRNAERDGGLRWLRCASDRTVTDLMQRASVVLYPSLWEGFGFPALEGLAHGAPVVVGDTPALREVLGDQAHWCDPHDVESIRGALERSLRVDALSESVVAARRSHVDAFRWSDCAERYARIYDEVSA